MSTLGVDAPTPHAITVSRRVASLYAESVFSAASFVALGSVLLTHTKSGVIPGIL